MGIRFFSEKLAVASVSLAFAWLASDTNAQQPPTLAKPLTVERIAYERGWETAMPRNFAWSADGKSLAFIRTTPGVEMAVHGPASSRSLAQPVSEIFAIDAKTGKERILVSAAELNTALGDKRAHPALGDDDEKETKLRQLKDFVWAPDGHALLLGTSLSLAWFDLDTHISRPLITDKKDISNPTISPDGRTVGFIQDRGLWIANVANGALRELASQGNEDMLEGHADWVYRNEFGLRAAYWWSPDSASIAWMQTDDRAVEKYSLRNSEGDEESIPYPKPGGVIPKIGLMVTKLSGVTVPVDLGSDANVYIPRVQWLPDGKHLAIERLSRSQKVLDLLIADPETGKAHSILSEKDAYWINLNDDLHFLKDSNRFLWSSERTGYRHIYLYDISGRQIVQLTQGQWEVSTLNSVDEAAGVVYFTATEADLAEHQIYRVNLNGSGFTRITQQKGTHAAVFSPASDLFLDTWSDRRTPPQQTLLYANGKSIGNIPNGFPVDAIPRRLASTEFFTIKSHQGTEMNAWMMKPPDFDPARKYPVILYAAGGPGEQIVRDAWGGDISLWFALMAQNGYIVFAMDNRGSAGHGHLFEEPIHLRFSGTEMADLRDGVLYLHSQPWIDKTRVGICGWGFGGFLAVHGMLDRPLLYKAGFAGSPITDWHSYDAVFSERYLEDPVANQDGWLSSSPVDNARNLNGSLLLAQATLDEKVHMENSLQLLDELLDQGKYADILLFPDRQDLFEDRTTRRVMFQHLTDFFLKNL